MQEWYILGDNRSDWFILAQKEWAQTNRDTVYCGTCATVNRDLYPQPIDVILSHMPRNVCASFVFRVGIGVIRSDLLELLSPFLKDFAVGKCLKPNGGEYRLWSTYYHHSYLKLHTKSDKNDQKCPVCGTIRTRGAAGDLYIHTQDVDSRRVMQGQYGRLLVCSRLADLLRRSHMRGLQLIPIPLSE
jgi:hypothetical protein